MLVKLIETAVPTKYNMKSANDSNNCVIGSAEGVKMAPKIVEKSKIGRQIPNIIRAFTIFVKLRTTWTIGNWKTSPVLINKPATKL